MPWVPCRPCLTGLHSMSAQNTSPSTLQSQRWSILTWKRGAELPIFKVTGAAWKCSDSFRSHPRVTLGYKAVSARRGQLSWNLEGLQPGPKLKRRKHEKEGSVWKLARFWWKAKSQRESQIRRRSKGKHRAKDETSAYVSSAYLEPVLEYSVCLRQR